MSSLYSDTATFSDPVFPKLAGNDIRRMWKMLLTNAKDLEVEYEIIGRDENSDGALWNVEWNAIYTFSKTQKTVHNFVESTIEIKDGKIISHTDDFNFWKWASMAFGLPGQIFGWTPIFHKKVQEQALQSLKSFKE